MRGWVCKYDLTHNVFVEFKFSNTNSKCPYLINMVLAPTLEDPRVLCKTYRRCLPCLGAKLVIVMNIIVLVSRQVIYRRLQSIVSSPWTFH